MQKLIMTLVLVLLTTLAINPTTVYGEEVYRWVDKNGVVHFGDRPPEGVEATPMSVKPNTVQTVKPENRQPEDIPAEGDAEAENEPELSYAEQRRQDRSERRRESLEEARKREANCEIMRRQKALVEPSSRVLVDDGNGGTRRLDDNERLEALNEANAYIAEHCN